MKYIILALTALFICPWAQSSTSTFEKDLAQKLNQCEEAFPIKDFYTYIVSGISTVEDTANLVNFIRQGQFQKTASTTQALVEECSDIVTGLLIGDLVNINKDIKILVKNSLMDKQSLCATRYQWQPTLEALFDEKIENKSSEYIRSTGKLAPNWDQTPVTKEGRMCGNLAKGALVAMRFKFATLFTGEVLADQIVNESLKDLSFPDVTDPGVNSEGSSPSPHRTGR